MSFGARFRGLRLIKRSHHAEVYEATMIGVGGIERRVALKQLRQEAAADEQLRAAFLEEARLGAQLSCPGLVPVLELGTVDGTPFIISELVDGESLTTVQAQAKDRNERLPEALALHVGLEVCRTVAFLHDATDLRGRPLGLIHRDLSPNNVLLSWQGAVRVIDLGIAGTARRQHLDRSKVVMGTEGYTAPELLRGDLPTQAADVFALGCLIHFLLTGTSPIADPEEHKRVLSGGTVKISSSITGEVGEVLRRALAFDPARRFATAQPLATALWPLLAARAREDPTIALRAWLGAMKPEETVTKLAGVAGLFDLQLLEGMISDGYDLPQYTSVAPTPMGERPASVTRPTPPPSPSGARESKVTRAPRQRLLMFALLLIAVSASSMAAAYWTSGVLTSMRPAELPVKAPPVVEPRPVTLAATPSVSPTPIQDLPVRAPEVVTKEPPRSVGKESPRKDPRPVVKRDDARVRRALRAKGLELEDVQSNAATKESWRAWAERSDGAAAAESAERGLLSAITSLVVDDQLVSQRLERAERRLAGRLEGRSDAEQIERRFLDLRVVAARARSAGEREDALRALSTLMAELGP